MIANVKTVLILCCLLTTSCFSSINQKKTVLDHKADVVEIQNLLHTSFNEEDKILFSAIQKVIQSFQALSNDKFEKTLKLSKDVLYTPGLTPEIYKFSLKSYSLAKLILVDQSFASSTERKLEAKNYTFNDFQYDECTDLCNSIGWSILAQNNPYIFTPEGNSKYVVTKKLLTDFNLNLKNLIESNIIYPTSKGNNYLFLPNFQNESQEDEQNLPFNTRKFENLNPHTDIEKAAALNLFKNGRFKESINAFTTLTRKSMNLDFLSMCFYWIGRNYLALNDYDSSEKYFNLSGATNPLNLYDALSGQMLKNLSGRASTLMPSPFLGTWQNEMDQWIDYPNTDQFNSTNIKETFNINIEFIRKSLKSSLLLLALIYEENKFKSFGLMQDYFLNIKHSDKNRDKFPLTQYINFLFLNDQVNWLKSIWPMNMQFCCSSGLKIYISNSITWLIYSTGNYLSASFFAKDVKNDLDLSNEKNNFLYFVFYPLPYKNEFTKISKKYSIDRDILYAIYRQNNLFFKKPTEADLIESAGKIKSLLIHYDNNIVYALAAYRAGSNLVDKWLKNSLKFHDDVLFVEFIPNKDIQSFVFEVLRNYYNIKWIYSDKEPAKWWKKMLTFPYGFKK